MGPFWALSFAFICFFSVVLGETNVDEIQTFIARVQNDLKPSEFSDVEEWYGSTLRSLSSNPLDSENPTTTQRGNDKDLLYVYKTVFHGFSARLTKQQAQILKRRPEILGVFPDRVHQIQTTRSPQFLGLVSSTPNSPLTLSDSGSNIVIGILDTGIWPERLSFRDEGLGPIPSHWKGECVEGEKFSKTLCNKKLIGARYFSTGYDSIHGAMDDSTGFKSARDSDGHGTHTASTAAGMHVGNASFLDFAKGVAVGIAPKARIAIYKICWSQGCLESDILAAFDKAVEDGVDIISLSIGPSTSVPYNLDAIAIGSFGAMEKGVLVSTSAGNSGPAENSVCNVAPWLISVGAGTIDRNFSADLVLEDGRVFTGASLYKGPPLHKNTYLPLIYAGDASVAQRVWNVTGNGSSFSAAICMPNSLDPKLIRGKIVVCDRGGIPRAAKGLAVKKAGGAGVIVANVASDGEGLVADAHLIPGLSITEAAGQTVRSYISLSQNPKANIVFRGTQVGVKPAPVVASFSSRGPNPQSIYVLKPDLIAPGVNILAAWPDDVPPTELQDDPRRTAFNIISGTSMSCPHVSGLAALLKGTHPDWSPAMIRSALMTTAYIHDQDGNPILDEKAYNTATVWDMGAGHVDPVQAIDPGLVYDLTADDYLNFLCASNYSRLDIQTIARRSVNCSGKPSKPWDLNYPAIIVDFHLSGSSKLEAVVNRTVTHSSDGAGNYTVSISNPKGASVTVEPIRMEFREKGEKKSYRVRISADNASVPVGNIKSEFGRMAWSRTDGKHRVKTPIGVVWHQP